MLGMVIGVGAVVILVALGTGTKNMVESQVEGLGSRSSTSRGWSGNTG